MRLESAAHAIGKDGFNWWIGQVENDGSDPDNDGSSPKDYDYTNKVKCRIVGYHNPDKVILPTTDLPWATCMFPVMFAQRSGIGTNQQLQIGSWVVGFFMDGDSAQLPMVMGSIPDENPEGSYKKEPKEGEENRGFQPILAPDYIDKKMGKGGGSQVGGTADTVSTNDKTGTNEAVVEETTDESGSTVSTVNPRGGGAVTPDAGKAADEKKKYTIHVGNGKCGTPSDVKIKGALAEFLKFARGVEKNDIGEWIDKKTGKLEDMEEKIEAISGRIQGFMGGAMGNIKGTILSEANKHIQKVVNDIKIPNPDLLQPARDQLKNISDLVNCLFKQIFDELVDVIAGMLRDLLEQALDAALCLAQDIFGDLFGGLMDKIMAGLNTALGILQGALGAIKGAADMIQGLSSKILDLVDMVCDGDLSCALGLSTFETAAGGGKEGEADKSKKAQSQYADGAKAALKKKGTQIIGSGIPNSRGFTTAKTLVDGKFVKKAFNTVTGEFAEVGAPGTGISSKSFEKGKSLVEKFDSIYPIRDSDGKINYASLNCSPANTRKAPCFPELIWDNAQSTSIIKALPIIDDIGSMVGVFMRGKGSDVGVTAKVRAMFTCNEPEGSGAVLKPMVKNGKIEKVQVLKTGIGYGLDPDNTYCPREQVVYLIPDADLQDYADEGDLLYFQPEWGNENEAKMQVVAFNHESTGYMSISTLDKDDPIPEGVGLQTAGGTYKFILNPVKKFLDLAIPNNAVAIWANCSDLLPVLDTLEVPNVGGGYTKPVIKVGPEEIGTVPVDTKGRLLKPVITKKTIGFVKPRIVDPTGTGAQLVPTYNYVGPSKFKELYSSQTYIDCVGHPEL